MIQISIDFILIGITVLVSTLTVLYVYLVCKARIENIKQRKKEAYIAANLPEWDSYFRDEIALHNKMLPRNASEIQGVESIFFAYIKNFSDVEIREKIKAFSNQYLKEYYRNILKSKKWSIRLNALYRIIDFQIEELLDECRQLERQKPSHEEYFQLLSIYSRMDIEHFFNIILSPQRMLSENEYKKLLLALDSESLKILADRFDDLSNSFQYGLIAVLGLKRDIVALSFLEDKLNHVNAEIRIRALKAISEIGVITNLEQYLSFVDSLKWEERLMAARLLRNIPLQEALPYLKQLLHDESWWVRSEAALTISQSRHGKEVLKEITKKTTDPFAVDMATEYITRSS
jgi:hypothetical protein